MDPKFWLVNLVTLLIQGSTLPVYCLYKDLLISYGYNDYTSLGLSLIGIGDVFGRFLTGALNNFEVNQQN